MLNLKGEGKREGKINKFMANMYKAGRAREREREWDREQERGIDKETG